MTQKEITVSKVKFNKAYDDFSIGLNSYAFIKVHDKDIGNGLVQDTYVKAWKYILRGGKIIVIKSLLYHILNHLIIDEYRKNKNISLNYLSDKGFEPSVVEMDKWIIEIDGKNAQKIILMLPFSYIKIMNMRYIQDLSIFEISEITGKTKNNITVILHRGLEKLTVINTEMINKKIHCDMKTDVGYFK